MGDTTNLFTTDELRDLAAQASTIDERLAGGYLPKNTAASRNKARRRVQEWCKISANGDEHRLRKRLGRDAITLEAITPLLGDVELAADHPVPNWIKTFSWAIQELSSHIKTTHSALPLFSDQPFPFENLFLPLVIAARHRRDNLRRESLALLSDGAHLALERSLLRRLTELCAPTLYEGFTLIQLASQSTALFPSTSSDSSAHAAYDTYITELRTGGLRDYFFNRPVLARLASTVVEQWIETTSELICRLSADYLDISKIFSSGSCPGPVISVEADLSDYHNGGRTVCALTFATGLKVAYKPKDLSIDLAWHELLNWLKEHEVPLPSRVPKVLCGQGYGWMEWINPTPCSDRAAVRRFFSHAGSILSLLQMLQGTDFHCENVIAASDEPVLIDLETLMHPFLKSPVFPQGPRAVLGTVVERLRDSVLATGYLPNWAIMPGGQIVGVGGLSPVERNEIKRWTFRDINTDAMRLEKVDDSIKSTPHIPHTDEISSSGIYSKEMTSGFRRIYSFFLANRSALSENFGPLSIFKGRLVRVVLRPTQLYELIAQRSQEPENLSSGVDWSLHFEFLSRFVLREDDPLWPVQIAERCALSSLDIPYFTARTDVNALQLSGVNIVEDCFESTSHEHTVSRVKRLDEAIMRTQITIIEQSLESAANYADRRKVRSPGLAIAKHDSFSVATSTAVRKACDIAAMLQREAVWTNEGAAWIGAVPLPGEQRVQLGLAGYDLYSGAGGIALFLSALHRIKQVASYRNLALAALAPWREELRDRESGPTLARVMGLGGGTGLGSVVYALVRVAEFLHDASVLDDAQLAAELITESTIAADLNLDVIAGAAGAGLGLTALYSACRSDSVLDRAITSGRRLLKMQVDVAMGGRAWKTRGDKILTGFSHGAAGISYALLRLYQVSGEPQFLRAAQGGIEYERGVFLEQESNWPITHDSDAAKDSASPNLCQWCYGATGIGMARLGGLTILDDDDVRSEIDIAVRATKKSLGGDLDSLCCGNFGRLDLLLSAGLSLDRVELIDAARRHAWQLLFRAESAHSFGWVSGDDTYNPGLFNGIAGIGYELLRLADPRLLPSVLLWE